MVNFLLGQQRCFTKHPCHLCLWDSWDRDQHWFKQDSLPRPQLQAGGLNLVEKPLFDRSKIVPPPLHIMLGLIKQFVKALNKSDKLFLVCHMKKMKARIFVGPQIRKLINDSRFEGTMALVEKEA